MATLLPWKASLRTSRRPAKHRARGRERVQMTVRDEFLGNWRIMEMDLWGAEDLDLLGPAKIVFEGNNDGHVALLAMAAEIDDRVIVRAGLHTVEFSFDGFDEDQLITGRGWAIREGGYLRGRLFFHQGDESAFVANQNAGRRTARVRAERRATRRDSARPRVSQTKGATST